MSRSQIISPESRIIIEPLDYGELPADVRATLDTDNQVGLSPSDMNYHQVSYEINDVGYVGIGCSPDEDQCLDIHLIDYRNGITGVSYVSLYQEDVVDCKDKPYLYWTQTVDSYRRQGLAARRLKTMGLLTDLFLDRKLHSDTANAPYVKNIWEKLVQEGLAQRYQEGSIHAFESSTRYCLV